MPFNSLKKYLFKYLLAIPTTILLLTQCTTDLVNGIKVPNIALPNPQKQTLQLKDINKNKIVLIDFWASWCKPCRQNNPKIISIYHHYKNSTFQNNATGFEVYSVSLDNNTQNWLNAIQNDQIPWLTNVVDTTAFASPYTKKFQFLSIPTSYLIDQNGIIIGKNLTPNQIDYELKRRIKK